MTKPPSKPNTAPKKPASTPSPSEKGRSHTGIANDSKPKGITEVTDSAPAPRPVKKDK
jgi:hypothetical protein